MKRMDWRRRLLLATAVAIGTLLVGEIGARALLRGSFRSGERLGHTWKVLARFDPKLGWANDSGVRAFITTVEFSYRARINSQGFRDPETPIRKLPGLRRLLFLGDSMTWGWGVDDGERFTDLIAADLAPGFEVINAAVPGYGTDQDFWTLEERGDSLAPDFVVLVFIFNDIQECESALMYGNNKPRFVLTGDAWNVEGVPVSDPRSGLARELKPLAMSLVAHSALASGVQRWTEKPVHAQGIEATGHDYRPQVGARVREVAQRILDARSPSRHALNLIRTWCAKRGVPFAVIVLPHRHDEYLYEPLNGRPEFDGQTELTQALNRVGRELDFPVLDVDARMFEATEIGQRLHCGDGHLNVAGNQLVADTLGPKLKTWLATPR
ncbi:MAG TPA: SGNH/GDSL hydrolase family protein [Planctomycetota bacterium]|nr:SGNH/GDSL hydrolase family protein [Planctomycetota bacterium]